MTILTLGHKIPDTDSITGAINLAYLLNARELSAKAVALGTPNPETKFILNRFGFQPPEIIANVADKDIFIVDTTELPQLPDDLNQANIIGIVDHHKLGAITTATPLEMWVQPVGCSNTIIKRMFDFYNINIPKNHAGLMLSAILSDTVVFKSPTTTEIDKQTVQELAEIVGIEDYIQFGIEIFTAKSEISGCTPKQLIMRDYKEFNMNNNKVGCGQLELIDINTLNDIKDDILSELKKMKNEHNYHTVLLLLTDIMKEGSELLILSDNLPAIQKALNFSVQQNAWLNGVLSRKKQIIPQLTKIFES